MFISRVIKLLQSEALTHRTNARAEEKITQLGLDFDHIGLGYLKHV